MRVQSSPVDSRSTTPHSHMAARSSPVRAASQRARSNGVAAKQLDGIAPHEDSQVVLGFGQEAVRIDQLEAAVVLESVQLVHVAVDQHGPLVAVRLPPPASAGQGMVDSLLGARTVELLPRRHDEVGEPSGLGRPRGQPAVWRRPPYARSGGAENLQATGERQSKLIHGQAQPLHEQRALVGVVPVEHRASVSADEAEDGRLVGGVVPGPWDEHLQDGRGTIRPGRVRHEGLGAALVGVPDCDRPVGLQAETSAGNRSSQSSAPTARALFRTTAGTSIIAAVSQKLNKGPKISVGESRRSGSESIFCGCPHGVGAVARGDGMMMAVDPVGGRGAMAGGGAARHTGAVVPRPVLIGRLGGPARVTVVSGAAGSGKTVLLRSWIGGADLAGRAAWVDAGRDVRDPQSFWLSVVGALRGTGPGSELVRAVSAAPDLDGWALVERLLDDLAPLEERLWLVVDDVHELDADQALRQLELLLMRAPPALRFVLATRHDVRLGLHRLRLEGELAEIRAGDLRFSLAEAGELFAAAGVELPGPAVAVLHERTEGWAAGLRLAALAAARHPDPERFAAGFSGTERTVAEYLLAEVLERQGERVRRLLLRTSILDRVNGELAHLLTGDEGAERVLQDLEAANAFVTSLDGARSWFRYPPDVRRAAAAGAAAHRARRGRRAAPGGRRVAGRARVPGGSHPAGPGGAGLGPGRAAAGRPLARPLPGRADRRHPRAGGRVPGRPDGGRCRACGGGSG